jgi:hypothetical protein
MTRKKFPSACGGRMWFGALLLLFPFLAAKADDMTSTLMIGGGRIDVTIESGNGGPPQADVLRWVQWAAESVTVYYGRFSVPRLELRVIPFGGSGVRHGQTWGKGGGLIRIHVGDKTTAAEFAEDWMLTHEMIHLAFPSVADQHHWIEEGISTYVEPIARIRAGHMNAHQMWNDLVRDMPKGLPENGDEGLDHTHTWGRTYWGGALFCFVADVEIRKQTKNKKGLEDALRGVLEAGGDIREDWDLEKTLETGDRAVGLKVLQKLYGEWKDRPVQVDLTALWKQLGVESAGGKVRVVDDAPLAAVRRAIVEGTKAGGSKRSGKQPAASARPLTIFAGRTAGSR